MINHARNLLLNVAPTSRPPLGEYGEEFIDPGYHPVTLSKPAAIIRSVLFGSNPDNFTLNYRGFQYMSTLHADDTAQALVLSMDRRFTYRRDDTLYDLEIGTFSTLAAVSTTTNLQLVSQNTWQGDEAQGRHERKHFLYLDLGNADATYLRTENPQGQISVSNQLDVEIQLPGTQTTVKTQATGAIAGTEIAAWTILQLARPRRTLPEIVEALHAELPSFTELWQRGGRFRMFETMATTPGLISRQLSGYLLTYIWHLEDLRNV